MRHYRFPLFFVLGVLATFVAVAQDKSLLHPTVASTTVIQDLPISAGATTVLIFPVAICENCIDRGHPDLSTSVVPGVSNVLRVKAASNQMPATNLTVFTIDGMIYSFSVRYNPTPASYLFDFSAKPSGGQARFEGGRMNAADIASCALVTAATAPRRSGPVSRKVGDVYMRLHNILLKDGVMFLSFGIRNGSPVDYDLDITRFYVRDRKRVKRTSMMETKIEPLHLLSSPSTRVSAKGQATIVIAVPKFTIAEGKMFCAEVFEQGGDRVLQLRLKGRHLLQVSTF
ncbi:DUF4138 domain-containing protein [Chitinophaga barathri]|uniref:DUF4138 domain-containing protein n=1 Tax=Chitinophaga barathri TaxID=1647451 RepID=A0A3N4MGI8_9BACT|nr:DUF4138 domain-containing protein [Chitinophaga barathri]RPD43084.1 DUF4138 domain-containing protein [Chitinophaga barathri]